MSTFDTFEDNSTFERNSSEDIWGPVRSHLAIVSVLSIIYGFIFIFGFFGNIITCVVVIRNKYMHTVTNFYLLSLAVSDLVLLISGLPVEMYQIWFKYPYMFGETFCILQGLAAETSANATVLTITAFTIERYIAICYPFVSRNAKKLKRAIRYIILIWGLSFIFAIPQAFKLGLVYAKDGADNVIQELSICSIKNDFIPHSFEISMMLFFVVPMTIITILYILIGLKLRRPNVQNSDKRDPVLILTTAGGIGQQQLDHDDDLSSYVIHSQSTKRVVKMLVAVVVTFFVCWAPFQVQRLVAVYGYAENDTSDRMFILYEVVTYVSGVLYYLSTVINPILYNIMSNKFRQAFQDTLKICPCRHRRNVRRNSGEIGNSSLPRFNFELKNYNSLVSGSNRAIHTSYLERVTDLHHRPLVISFRKQPYSKYTINRSQIEMNKLSRIDGFSLHKCSHSCSLPGIAIRMPSSAELPHAVELPGHACSRHHHRHPCALPHDRSASMFYSE